MRHSSAAVALVWVSEFRAYLSALGVGVGIAGEGVLLLLVPPASDSHSLVRSGDGGGGCERSHLVSSASRS